MAVKMQFSVGFSSSELTLIIEGPGGKRA